MNLDHMHVPPPPPRNKQECLEQVEMLERRIAINITVVVCVWIIFMILLVGGMILIALKGNLP